MSNPSDFSISKHAMERLLERDKLFAKNTEHYKPALKIKAMYEYLKDSSEEKRFLNNSTFMIMLGEKYGFDKQYTMFIKNDSVFVGVINNTKNVIVTVLDQKSHYLNHIKQKVQKFKCKKETNAVYFPPGSRK